MLKRAWIAATVFLLTYGGASAKTLFFDFNSYDNGPLHGQDGWWSDLPHLAKQAFNVMDGLGVTATPGDKALGITHAADYVKITNFESAVWKPGQTYILEFQFRVGLTAQKNETDVSVMTLLLGDSQLDRETRWELNLNLSSKEKWTFHGRIPHEEEVKSKALIERPKSGMAVSEWYRFKLSAKKLEVKNMFEVTLEVRDPKGKAVVNHTFKNNPLPDNRASIWEQENITTAFSARDNINGLVCIDNLAVLSE